MKRSMSLCFVLLVVGACGDKGTPADAAPPGIDAPTPTGTASLSWTLSDGTDAISCEDIAAVTVGVSFVAVDGFGGQADSLACSAGTAMTRAIPVGTYNVDVELRASQNRGLGERVRFSDVVIEDGANTDLGTADFVASTTANISFTVDTFDLAGNCADLASQGAGIEKIDFEYRDSSGACVPGLTFSFASGGSFVSNCADVFDGCIENSDVVTVTGVPAGPGTLALRGLRAGDEECYARTTSLNLAGDDLATDLGEQGMIFSCDSP